MSSVKSTLSFALMLAPRLLNGQQVPPEHLKPANAQLAADFTFISSVRELRDGRVLLTDPREKRVVVADFTTGKLMPVGRIGSGPNEYPLAMPLEPLAGDSSLMADGLSRRWLLFDGARIVATIPPNTPVVMQAEFVNGADILGNVLMTEHTHSTSNTRLDSIRLMLTDRRTGRTTLLTHMAPLDLSTYVETNRQQISPFGNVWEEAWLARDGWVAVLRIKPYRVDWRSPDGNWVKGAPIPYPPLRVDARELAPIQAEAAKTGRRLVGLPTFLPPFLAQGKSIIPTEDEKVLILRTATVTKPGVVYDVVNRRGERERQLLLPANQRILGFSARSVYVVTRDDDDIERISRHPWP